MSANVLEIKLDAATPWFLELLAHPVAFPLHAEGMDEPLAAPVNGAFKIDRVSPHAMIRLVRNPHFHASDSVTLDTVEYLPIEDPTSELSRYRAGEVGFRQAVRERDDRRKDDAGDQRDADQVDEAEVGPDQA